MRDSDNPNEEGSLSEEVPQETQGNPQEESFHESDSFSDEYFDDIPKRRSNFFVDLFDKIENFKMDIFKKKVEEKKEQKKEQKKKKKILKDSSKTVDDIQKQRRDVVKHALYKVGMASFVIILISGAIIFSMQDNEQKPRPKLNIKEMLNDTTSFGNIDQKDYFLEQNVLDDKINMVEKEAKQERKKLKQHIDKQTETITQHIDEAIGSLEERQKEALKKTEEKILSTVDEKIESIKAENSSKLEKISKKVDRYKNAPRLSLKDGKLIFPNKANSSTSGFDAQKPLIQNPIKENKAEPLEEPEDEYEEVIYDMSDYVVEDMDFDTGLDDKDEDNKSENIEFDLTTSLVRVTLIDGVKAATLSPGLSNPSPALMTIEGVRYSANDNADTFLKGCMLRGVGIGNINTSRVEIFGTHLSCIFEADSGKKYKVEHDFPDNQVWIKGEDGADGVAGLIVDSSGKILSKTAAVGFLQGLSNYFSAQNLVTGGLATTTGQSTIAQLNTSMQSGVGTAMQSSFDLIIQQYEKLLNGYYPYIDVKGGRKNLTAVFGGKTKIIATPYKELNLEDY